MHEIADILIRASIATILLSGFYGAIAEILWLRRVKRPLLGNLHHAIAEGVCNAFLTMIAVMALAAIWGGLYLVIWGLPK